MGRAKDKLVATALTKLAKTPGRHSDGAGLYLYTRPDGRTGWILRYTHLRRQREMGLGSYPDVSLARAREKARGARELLDRGADPIESRKTEATAQTFGEYALAYVKQVTRTFKNVKHRQQWKNSLVTYCKPLWNVPVSSVSTPDVLACISPIWSTKNETARRVRGRIEAILASAELEGLRPEGRNPAQWRGYLEHHRALQGRPKVQHHAALPFSKVPALVQDLRGRDAMAARVLEFLILTAARSGEARGATWDEVDLEAGVWSIPGERMKMARPFRVPLSSAAIRLLKTLHDYRISDLVFPGGNADRPLTDVALSNLLKKRMKLEGATPHGFRTSFRTWFAESYPGQFELGELCLAHKVGSAVSQAYNRSDLLEQRTAVMETWGRYCDGDDLASVLQLNAYRK